MAGTGDNNAIGILFGVKGGGSISGESGSQINTALNQIVAEINKNPKLIKFTLDTEAIKGIKLQLDGINVTSKSVTESIKENTVASKENAKVIEEQAKSVADTTKNIDAAKTAYESISSVVMEYVKALNELAKISKGESGKDRSIHIDKDGKLTSEVSQAEEAIKRFEELQNRYKSISLGASGTTWGAGLAAGSDISKMFQSLEGTKYQYSVSDLIAKTNRSMNALMAMSFKKDSSTLTLPTAESAKTQEEVRTKVEETKISIEEEAVAQDTVNERLNRTIEALEKINSLKSPYTQLDVRGSERPLHDIMGGENASEHLLLNTLEKLQIRPGESKSFGTKRERFAYGTQLKQNVDEFNEAYRQFIEAKDMLSEEQQEILRNHPKFQRMNSLLEQAGAPQVIDESLNGINDLIDSSYDSIKYLAQSRDKESLKTLYQQVKEDIPNKIDQFGEVLGTLYGNNVLQKIRSTYNKIFKEDISVPKKMTDEEAQKFRDQQLAEKAAADEAKRTAETRARVAEKEKEAVVDKQAETSEEAKVQSTAQEVTNQQEISSQVEIQLETQREINQAKEEGTTKDETEKANQKETNAWLQQNLELIREYYAARGEMMRISGKNGSVSMGEDGLWNTTDPRYVERVANINRMITTLRSSGMEFKGGGIIGATEEQMKSMASNLNVSVDAVKQAYNEALRLETGFAARQEKITEGLNRTWANNAAKANNLLNRYANTKMSPTQLAQYTELKELVEANDPKNLDRLTYLQAELQRTLDGTMSWATKFMRTFGSRVRSMFAGTLMGIIMRTVRGLYTSVKDIDSALTQLSIVTGENEEKLKSYSKTMITVAQQIGASASDLLKSSETFARLGYSLDESGVLAKLTAMYAKVADTDVSSATSAITSIVKAFDVDPSGLESVLDKLMYVGQNYPISASEIGEGMQNAGSALKTAGNDITESMGILTAANTTVQNISKSSTAVRTIIARLNASTAELEEMGEEVTGVTTRADLDRFLKAFGVGILDANGELRKTYDILKDLSAIWDDLSSTDRSAIAKKLAGTRQQNIFFSLMESFGSAEDVVSSIGGADGLLSEATEKRINSIQGKIDILTAKLQDFATRLLESDIVKFFVDVLNTIIDVVSWTIELTNKIGGLKTALTLVVAVLASIKARSISVTLSKIVGFLTTIPARLRETTVALHETNSALEVTAIRTTAIVAVVAALMAAEKGYQSLLDSRYKKNEEHLKDGLKELKQYDDEISSLEELHNRLEEAKGDRTKLSAVYDDLSKRIQVNTAFIDGEANAYEAAKKQLEALLKVQKQERKTRRDRLIDEYESTSGSGAIKQKDVFGNDWFMGRIDGKTAREIAAGEARDQGNLWDEFLRAFFGKFDNSSNSNFNVDLGFGYTAQYNPRKADFNSMSKEEQDSFLRQYSISREDWEAYWKEQVDIAKEIFAEEIEASDGYLGSDIINSLLENFVLNGASLDTISSWFDKFVEKNDYLATLSDKFYTAISEGNREEANGLYNEMIKILENIKFLFPGVADSIDVYIQALNEANDTSKKYKVEQRSVLQILDQVQGGYDALISAQKDMDQYGVLSASTLKNILENYPDLIGYLEQTAAGYVMNADALRLYISGLIDAAVAEINLTTIGSADRAKAIENLKNLQTVLATLAVTTDYNKSAADEAKDALDAESDALNKQADTYKQLIDLRKKLLEQYRDEIKYKRQLEEKEGNVATLRTQYAVSQLDTSAAGRARSRKLAADLKQAEEDLDDFTLEHAIDVVTSELDDQYEEYKNMIDARLEEIKDAIDGLSEGSTAYADSFKEAIAQMSEWIDSLVIRYTNMGADVFFNRGENIVESPHLKQPDAADYGNPNLVYDTFTGDPVEYIKNIKNTVDDIKTILTGFKMNVDKYITAVTKKPTSVYDGSPLAGDGISYSERDGFQLLW